MSVVPSDHLDHGWWESHFSFLLVEFRYVELPVSQGLKQQDDLATVDSVTTKPYTMLLKFDIFD